MVITTVIDTDTKQKTLYINETLYESRQIPDNTASILEQNFSALLESKEESE